MKGYIDKDGFLFLEKLGSRYSKKQLCMYQENAQCGTWCPQFGEPSIEPSIITGKRCGILICQGRKLTFEVEE